MYDPNQVPRQVRMSVYLKGTNDEVRNSYGIPIQFNELFTSFNMSGVMVSIQSDAVGKCSCNYR